MQRRLVWITARGWAQAVLAGLGLLGLVWLPTPVAAATSLAHEAHAPALGTLERVAALDINPGNITLAPDGRVFVTVHQFRREPVQLIEVTGERAYRAWPDAIRADSDWNGAFGRGGDTFNNLLGVQTDRAGRLWVLDNGLGPTPQPPKLLAFDLGDGALVERVTFDEAIAPPGSFLNDLAVDAARGMIYIADLGGDVGAPGLVVVDLDGNRARRFSGHPALQAEDIDLRVEGAVLTFGAEGPPVRVGVNPITLSADGQTLYFGAMNGTVWYAVATSLLRDWASDAVIAEGIRAVGPKPPSDGAATDRHGNHYFTAVERNAIMRLTPTGALETIVEDPAMLWPDALAFGPEGWLYIAVNQLHRSPPIAGAEQGAPPYPIFRVWVDRPGVVGR